MKALRNTVIVILLLLTMLSIWFISQITKLKQQLTTNKNNSLTASTTTPTEDFESRLRTLEDYFE